MPLQVQREFFFYSSSILIIYEGDAADPAHSRVSIKLVDFAHTWQHRDGQRDENFISGLRAVIDALTNVMGMEDDDHFKF